MKLNPQFKHHVQTYSRMKSVLPHTLSFRLQYDDHLLTLVLRMWTTTSVFGLSADLSNKYSMMASLLYSLVEENAKFTMVSLYINTIASLLWQKYCRHILNTGNNICFIIIVHVFIILMP